MGQASVLLVEDEALIRMMLVDMIEELGHRVVAEAGSVVEGKSLAEIAKFDIAVLDINIAGLSIQPVAETIAAACARASSRLTEPSRRPNVAA